MYAGLNYRVYEKKTFFCFLIKFVFVDKNINVVEINLKIFNHYVNVKKKLKSIKTNKILKYNILC